MYRHSILFPHVFVLPKSVCISEFITLISGLLVWIVKSSANKSEKQYFSMRGKSFINKRNKVVPRIEACGTPDLIVENDENPKPLSMACWRDSRYEVNHLRDMLLNLYAESLLIRMLWSTKSKAFLKSIKRAPTVSPLSILAIHWSMSFTSAVWQLCRWRKPDWLSWIK